MQINVVLADDHPALIAGVKYALEAANATIKVTGTAKNSSEIVELLKTVPCDVLVADYSMPHGAYGDGITLFSYLRRHYADLKIIVFTMVDNPAIVREIARLGVHAYLSKSHDVKQLIVAIHAVYAHANYFPRDVGSTDYDEEPATRDITEHAALSKREAEVVRFYVSGKSINEIAKALNRSKQTISSQKANAMRKLGIKRDADLFRYAWEVGLGGPLTTPVAGDPMRDNTQ